MVNDALVVAVIAMALKGFAFTTSFVLRLQVHVSLRWWDGGLDKCGGGNREAMYCGNMERLGA